MVKICVVGGKLQGVEACYLAQKANWQTVLIDKNPNCLAKNVATEFVVADILAGDVTDLVDLMKSCDFVLPALENAQVLAKLQSLAAEYQILLAFDGAAYEISSSKLKSDKFFVENDVPAPKYYPEGNFPMIAKPSGESGSQGVVKILDQSQLDQLLGSTHKELVVQEYLEGPSYSIEVVGNGKDYVALEVTEIIVDEVYDCKRVEAGLDLPAKAKEQMCEIGKQIGEKLCVNGIFDVETIYADGKMKVLEIDARIPSQTPTAVYHSCGINILEVIFVALKNENLDNFKVVKENSQEHFVIYEHILVEPEMKNISFHGEHIMSEHGSLTLKKDFCGAVEALTSEIVDDKPWVATMIFKSEHSMADCRNRQNLAMKEIEKLYLK